MTTGEGGAVATADPTWARAVASLREWGRDCWCPPGVNDVCGRRFEGRFGALPAGYDHKYVFSHVGYNFKLTDMQAALGVAQTHRLESFAARRQENFERLHAVLRPLEEQIVLPRALPGAEPNWFGYPITLREGGAVERRDLQMHLLEHRIDSRLLLAGNMTLQPGFQGLDHGVAGSLATADRVTEAALWVGCHPGLSTSMINWVAECVTNWVEQR
jgi:CDP-6-deoxy-D-xylo-4-hexulose-3-dehydrase